MIEQIPKAIDLLRTLIGYRGEIQKREFVAYVEPLHTLAESVYSDFMGLFLETRTLVKSAESATSVIEHLEARRLRYLSARMRLRAALNERVIRQKELAEFEMGIVRLLRGGFSIVEDSNRSDSGSISGQHVLLDLVYFLSDTDINETRTVFMNALEEQVAHLDRAYEMIARGYAAYQARIAY